MPAGHRGKHAVATGWDDEGRVDDGVSWSDTVDRTRALVHYSGERAKAEAEAGNIAWYAPRGVTMVAMTPQRIAALAAFSAADTYAHSDARREGWQWPTPPPTCVHVDALNAVLAEARGEVST